MRRDLRISSLVRLPQSIRPWRFEPAVLGIVFALFATTLVLPPSELTPATVSSLLIRRLMYVTLIGLFTYAYFRLGQLVLRRFRQNGFVFILISLAYGFYAQLLVNLAAASVHLQELMRPITDSPLFFLRVATATLILSVLTGRVFNSIDAQRRRAEDLRVIAERQRRDLLAVDEKVRQRVGSILHDRFQSELVTSALTLQRIAREADPLAQSELEDVIARLNALHGHELRAVLTSLGPNLEHIDLQTAVRSLALQFLPAMTCEVSVDETVDTRRDIASLEILLGLYRISEQALINAAKHGEAERCSVTVALDEEFITLTVSNDGTPLRNESRRSGHGTSVINSWASALKGDWTLTPGRRAGAVLTARVPRADRE